MTRLSTLICLVFLLFLNSGCSFIGLSQDVGELNSSVTISGVVESSNRNVPIIVTLNQVTETGVQLKEYITTYSKDRFHFSATDGRYYLLAFEDLNRNFTLDSDEGVAWFGAPTIIEIKGGEVVSDIRLKLLPPNKAKLILPQLYNARLPHSSVSHTSDTLGKVVEWSYFLENIGSLGMWEPVKFYNKGYSGIFFLEPYSQDKIPVIFVHGMGGSGNDWLYLINSLDREVFQPWIVQYPSGIDLSLISQMIYQSVTELVQRYDIKEIKVVAHSMGGLVARGFLNQSFLSNGPQPTYSSFITISTPWAGHKLAQKGIEYMPIAVPSWFNMAPNSNFIKNVNLVSLKEKTNFHLFFSYRDDSYSPFSSDNTDSVVSLESQLSLDVQDEAKTIYGLNEDHTGILRSPIMATKLAEALE